MIVMMIRTEKLVVAIIMIRPYPPLWTGSWPVILSDAVCRSDEQCIYRIKAFLVRHLIISSDFSREMALDFYLAPFSIILQAYTL